MVQCMEDERLIRDPTLVLKVWKHHWSGALRRSPHPCLAVCLVLLGFQPAQPQGSSYLIEGTSQAHVKAFRLLYA